MDNPSPTLRARTPARRSPRFDYDGIPGSVPSGSRVLGSRSVLSSTQSSSSPQAVVRMVADLAAGPHLEHGLPCLAHGTPMQGRRERMAETCRPRSARRLRRDAWPSPRAPPPRPARHRPRGSPAPLSARAPGPARSPVRPGRRVAGRGPGGGATVSSPWITRRAQHHRERGEHDEVPEGRPRRAWMGGRAPPPRRRCRACPTTTPPGRVDAGAQRRTHGWNP